MATTLPTPSEILAFYDEPEDVKPCASDSDTDNDNDEVEVDSRDELEAANEPSHPLQGKTVTICGSGSSLSQLFVENELGVQHGDEIWAVDNIAKLVKYDRLFYMEHPSKYTEHPDRIKWLSLVTGVVYVSEHDPTIPCGILYPIEDVVNALGLLYISSSAAYALALAICWKAAKIRLFGMDFDNEPLKRGCIEFLICKAVHTGINIEIPSTSSLLGNNLSVHKRLYGFEHSKDPFTLGVRDGKRCLIRASELPEQYTIAS